MMPTTNDNQFYILNLSNMIRFLLNFQLGALQFQLCKTSPVPSDVLAALFSSSNRSCDVDFDCSCPELRELVKVCVTAPGGLACRLTGAGWGGCVVAMVNTTQIEEFLDYITSVVPPDSVLQFTPGGGAEVVVV
jgi:galactokinase